MKVTLDAEQLAQAIAAGEARQRSAEAKRSRPAFAEAWPGQLLNNHTNAACAEMAVAVALGLKPSLGVDVYSVPDLDGTRIEVRWSRSRNHCKVTPRDVAKGRLVVGVVGDRPAMEILGWLEASDAPERGTPSKEPPPCWFIHELAWERFDTLDERRWKLAAPSDSDCPKNS